MTNELAVLCQVIGVALRHHRERLGLGLDDVAQVLKCDRSKVSRIETGVRGIRAVDLDLLLDEFAISGPERDTLLALAPRRGRSSYWWQDFVDAVPDGLREYLLLESCAASIAVYTPLQVPGLMQTPGYAHAAAGGPDVKPGLRDRAVRFTLARQKMVLNGPRRPKLAVILGEGTLHQQVGDADVMVDQIGRLAEIAADRNQSTVQVMPFAAGLHPCSGFGSVTVLRFAAVPYLDVVHLDGPRQAGICLIGTSHAAIYADALTRAGSIALSARESARLLAHMTASTDRLPSHLMPVTRPKTS